MALYLRCSSLTSQTTILNFRRMLEKHELAAGILAVIDGYLGNRDLSLSQGTIVDATLINAPSSTKNKDSKRYPGLTKNAAQRVTLFALSNLWMARRYLLTSAREVRL